MSNESPFFLSKVECPICKTINEFETVKLGAYYENGRDTDFCPQDIKWRFPRYQSYNPLVFFTATCSNCYYTREFTNNFKEWKKDQTFRLYRLKTVKEKHLDKLANADSIIRSMGEAIDPGRHPNKSGIIKIHLAIFDELLSERFSNLDLGRFYLRIGWIFRDLAKGANPNIQLLLGLLHEIDNKYLAYKNEFSASRDELGVFTKHLSAHFETDQLAADIKSRIYPYRDKFNEQIIEIQKSMESTDEKISAFSRMMDEYKEEALGIDSSSGEVNFGNYHSFTEFLMAMKKYWDGVVSNEREALEKAVLYYKKAFADGNEISQGNQQIQASYLIAELSRRIGDFDEARQYFNSTIKHGQEFIYQNRNDKSRTALARKILELAIEQGKVNMEALKSV